MRQVQSGNRRLSRTWEDKWSDPGFDPWWLTDGVPEEFLAALRDYAPNPASRLLDVGCGNGNLACLLSMTYPSTIGIDIAPAAISLARANALRLGASAKFELGDIFNDELPAGTFDVVIDRGCLHLMSAPDAIRSAGNIERRLRPGGIFIQMYRSRDEGNVTQDKVLQGIGLEFCLEQSNTSELRRRKRTEAVWYFVYSKKAGPKMEQ